jgi:hypothetical protein
MDPKDWISIALAGLALLWGIIAFFWNRSGIDSNKKLAENADRNATEANTIAKQANALSEQAGRKLSAESEIALLNLINRARMRVNELAVKIADIQGGTKDTKLNADQTRQLNSMNSIYEEAVEALLNSYELACGLYLDKNKIDDERFRRQYHDEINRLYDFPDPYRRLLHAPNTHYNAIRTVFNEWHNLEKPRTGN